MSDDLGDMLVEFKADLTGLNAGAEQAKRKLGEVDKSARDTGGGFKSMASNALAFAAGGVITQGLGLLKDQLGGVFAESMDAQAGMAQTVAALKSTHDASGETAQSVADLAGNLSHLTKFSDDTVQAGENMLLTFTNIGKNVFPEATRTVLDMSQALGQDTKSSAIQLGKALNDPITGMTALQRVGVTFDKTQKDLIGTYEKHGQAAKAQGVILKELQKEFGGTAEAAGKTFGGQLVIAGQYVDDFKQQLGDDLMPVVTKFLGTVEQNGMPILQNFSDWFTKDGLPGLENFAGGIADTINKSGAFQSVLKTVSDTLPGVEQFVGNVGDALENKLLPPTLSLIKNFSTWVDKSGILTDGLHLLGDGVTTVSGILGPFIQDLSNVFDWLSKNKPASDALVTAVVILGGAFVALKLANTVVGFGQMFTKISEGKGIVEDLANAFRKMAPNIVDIGKNAKTSAADVTVASAIEEADLTAVDTKVKTMNADLIATGPAAAEGGAAAKAGMAGFLESLGTAAGFAALLAIPFFTASPSTKAALFPDQKTLDSYKNQQSPYEYVITHMPFNQPSTQDLKNQLDNTYLYLQKNKQAAQDFGDSIDKAWQDMEELGAYAESHNNILGDMFDPLNITKADVKVQELKSHVDDLPKPVLLQILTPQVVAARQKVIDLKSHIDDIKGPVSIGVLSPDVVASRQKVIDLKSHIDDLHNPVSLSIYAGSVDTATAKVMYLKSQLDDMPSPSVSVSVPGGSRPRGYASGGFSPIGEPFMFNEQGPEMGMAVPGGVQFLSHPQSMNMLGGSGRGNTFHFHIEVGGREVYQALADDHGFVQAIGNGIVSHMRTVTGMRV